MESIKITRGHLLDGVRAAARRVLRDQAPSCDISRVGTGKKGRRVIEVIVCGWRDRRLHFWLEEKWWRCRWRVCISRDKCGGRR